MLSTVFYHEGKCNIKFTDLNKIWDYVMLLSYSLHD